MGYQTVFKIYNDATGEIEKHKGQVMREIVHALSSGEGSEFIGVGHHCNAMKIFPSVHSNDSSLYLLEGNDVTEMDPDSQETKKLMIGNPRYFKEAIDIIKQKINRLEEMSMSESQTPK